MAALTADRGVPSHKKISDSAHFVDFEVAASTVIYKGGFVGLNTSGYLKMCAPATTQATIVGDKFVGVAQEHVASQTSNGDATCRVQTSGIITHALSGAAITDIGTEVYISDDQTLTFAPTGATYVGKVVGFPSSGNVDVLLDSLGQLAPGFFARVATIDPTTADDLVLLVHQQENGNGILVLYAGALVATATDDSVVVEIEDTSGTDLNTLTGTATTGDALNDIVKGDANPFDLATGSAVIPIVAGRGIQAHTTTATATVGSYKVIVLGIAL